MADLERRPNKTWFATITRPASRLAVTISVFVVFLTGIVLGAILDEYRAWFYAPALAALVFWYIGMMRIYRSSSRATSGVSTPDVDAS